MNIEQNVYLAQLFDVYGKLLSKTQYDVLSDILNDDLTLTEVAANRKITRQAVKDISKKAETKLENFEEKLGFMKKLNELMNEINQLKGE